MRAAIVAFVGLLTFDMANPVLPGAFRLNPDETIQVVRSAGAAAMLPAVLCSVPPSVQPGLPPAGPEVSVPRHLRPRRCVAWKPPKRPHASPEATPEG
jgi:hypothetical protein